MIYKNISGFKHLKIILVLYKFGRIDGFDLFISQLWVSLYGRRKFAEKAEIKRPFNLKDGIANFEFFCKQFKRIRVNAFLNLQSHRRSPAAFSKLLLDFL
ncbi:hypothetical protein D3C78_1054380 [compost metagenome]